MNTPAVAVIGTFDSKGAEHLFLKEAVEARGIPALTINLGTKGPSLFPPDYDLRPTGPNGPLDRDQAVRKVIEQARRLVRDLHERGELLGVISAGGGTGTHIGTGVMRALPLGVPKVMVSTVASRDMSDIVGTKDITMIHSVGDLLGINSVSGLILDRAAAALCGMVRSTWRPSVGRKVVALTMFGFITRAAEMIKLRLEDMGHEVVAFHANGTGGLAMEELAAEGRFHAILDLATHELADTLKNGYCRLIGPGRLSDPPDRTIPRLVVPGGLDCAVLEFTRRNIPPEYQGRKIFFYDFRSAVRLTPDESRGLADELAAKLNRFSSPLKVLIPSKGWSEADREDAPLFDPASHAALVDALKGGLAPRITVREVDLHINDPGFAELAAAEMNAMMA